MSAPRSDLDIAAAMVKAGVRLRRDVADMLYLFTVSTTPSLEDMLHVEVKLRRALAIYDSATDEEED